MRSDGASTPLTDGSSSLAADFEAAITTKDLGVGQQRLAFVLVKDDDLLTDESVYVRFFKFGSDGSPTEVGGGPILWAPLVSQELAEEGHDEHDDAEEIPVTGIYYVNASFDGAGTWGLGVTRGDAPVESEEQRVTFIVRESTSAPSIGEKAVSAQTPTMANFALERIDTSPEPDPQFHRLSLDDALANGRPTVIAFATPAFCQTRTCGPTMDVIQRAYELFDGREINWTHIEPYELDENGSLELANGQLKTVPAVEAWGLESEPFVFVVDGDGTVVGRFEGPSLLEEIGTAIESALGG